MSGICTLVLLYQHPCVYPNIKHQKDTELLDYHFLLMVLAYFLSGISDCV